MDEWFRVKTLIDENIDHHDYIKHNIINRIIKLKDNNILQQSINHLHTTTVPTEILVPLYKKMYKNNDIKGIDHLIMYYYYKGADKKRFKYLNIGWYKFKDQRSLCSLIHYYSVNKDYDNIEKYHHILKSINPSIAQFMIGMEHKRRCNYDQMILNLKLFFDYVKKEDLIINDGEELNDYTKAYVSILRLFIMNEIELHFVQEMVKKFNIISGSIYNNIQHKLNKTKLTDYKKIGTCYVCLDEDIEIQLFDCLGHHYCKKCTVQLSKCPTCLCDRIHI
jgi:hypothetical protein